MPLVPDLRYQGAAVGLGTDQQVMDAIAPEPTERPAGLEVLTAAANQTLPGAAYQRFTNPDPDLPQAPDGWDVFDHLEGYEEYATDATRVQTPSELAGWKQRVDNQRSDRDTLARAGIGGVAAEIGFTVLDPSFLATIAVPELAVARSIRVGKAITSAAQGAAAGGAYELGMQNLQETRSGMDALYSVGGGALLGGVLGSLGRGVPKSEMDTVQKAVRDELNRQVRSESGAAAVTRATTLEAESFTAGGERLAKIADSIPLVGTDLDKIMASGSIEGKQLLGELADIPGITGKNFQDIASPASVESFVGRWDAQIANFSDLMGSSWKKYRDRVPKDSRLTQQQFYESVAGAARRGDVHAVPEIGEAASYLRSKIFDPLKEDAQTLGLMKDPVKQAQERSDKRAVESYYDAQESQLFADYQGRTRAAVKDGVGLEGDAAVNGEKSGVIQTESSRAVDTVTAIRDSAISDSEARVETAQATYKKEIAEARRNLDDTFAAAKADAESVADSVAENAGKRADRLALGIDIERQILELDIERAKLGIEEAQKNLESRSRVARAELSRDKARIEIYKARLDLEKARSKAAKEISAARKRFSQASKELKNQHGTSEIPAFNKDRSTAKAPREFRAAVKAAKDRLDVIRRAEQQVVRKEQRQFRAQKKKLGDRSDAALEKLKADNLKKFRKRAMDLLAGQAEDSDPAVQQLSKLIADKDAHKLLERIHRPQVDPANVKKVVGSETYFRRMYDRESIRANRLQWDNILKSHFLRGSKALDAEVAEAVKDVTTKILGGDVGQANFATQVTVPGAGPLKERVLDIPDELIEQFLVNDPVRVATSYVRDLAPQVEMARRFVEPDMKDALARVVGGYDQRIAGLKKEVAKPDSRVTKEAANAEIERLDKERTVVTEALVRVRDRVLGRAGRLSADSSDNVRRAVQASRGWRNFVASTKLGGTAMTGGVMDTTRIIAQYGFLPTMRNLAKLATSKEFRDLSKTQARRVGSAVEVALSRRVNAAYDGAITEGWTQKMADGLYKWTGLSHITDFNRTLGATLFEDKALKLAAQVADGGRPGKFDLARMASLGLDTERLKAIHAEFKSHGGETSGIRVSGSADWADKELADIYDAAILRESKIIVQHPGAADRAWWMDKEIGKFFGQLKTFSLSTPQRMLVTPLQMAGQGSLGGSAQAARFVGFMMAGGYLTHTIRQTLAGRAPTTDPAKAAAEAFTETGLVGVLPDIVSPFARMAGFQGGARYSDRNVASTFGGPAVGTLQDLITAGAGLRDGMSASDLHNIRRMLPWQNAWMLRRAVNAIEGEMAEGLELKGAEPSSFVERMTRTELPTGD